MVISSLDKVSHGRGVTYPGHPSTGCPLGPCTGTHPSRRCCLSFPSSHVVPMASSLYGYTKGVSALPIPRDRLTRRCSHVCRSRHCCFCQEGGPVREISPNPRCAKLEVAMCCVRAVNAEYQFAFIPYLYGRFGHLPPLYCELVPAFVERQARRKCNLAA